ncbi:hypothetical protein [Hyphococcus sp.]|uniref:hypothetical protein n=1 Tax=Hyphococcus sp. TaxID=2038636 RepID=UPI003CCC3AA1
MKSLRKTRNAFLAAASALAATAALHPATAADFDAVAHPATIEIQAVDTGAAVAADHGEEKAAIGAKKWALLATAAGALAALVKLIGANRVAKTVTAGAASAARVTARTASGAARVMGRTLSSPLRFLMVLFGLALFALTGVGLYDIEWIGGLLSGAALAGAGLLGFMKTRQFFQPKAVKIVRKAETEN